MPRFGLGVEAQELGIALVADHETVLRLHVAQRVVELGIDQQDRRTRVLDDVAHLALEQAEVHRHEDASVPTHTEERGEQARRVVAHDRDPFALRDAQAVEAGGLRPRQLGHAPVGELPPGRRRLLGLVDGTHPPAVDEFGPIEEIERGQWHLHRAHPLSPGRPDRAASLDRPGAYGLRGRGGFTRARVAATSPVRWSRPYRQQRGNRVR